MSLFGGIESGKEVPEATLTCDFGRGLSNWRVGFRFVNGTPDIQTLKQDGENLAGSLGDDELAKLKQILTEEFQS